MSKIRGQNEGYSTWQMANLASVWGTPSTIFEILLSASVGTVRGFLPHVALAMRV